MAGYPKLSKAQLQLAVGRTTALYKEGKTPEEIAKILGRHITEVEEWIGMAIRSGKIPYPWGCGD